MNHSNALFGTSTKEALSAIASASTPDVANAGPATTQSQIYQVAKPLQKRKRKRAILSCQPCHERKQQCDRAKPCSRCAARGSKDDCIYYEQPSHKTVKTKHGQDDELSDVPGPEQTGNTLGGIAPSTLMGLEALLQLVQASNAVTGTGPQLTLPGSAPDHAVHMAATALSQLSQQTTSDMPTTTGPMVEFLHQIRAGNQPQSELLANLRTHFPNHAITGHLLYHFFEHSSLPWLWAIIHKPSFDNCYITFSSGSHPPSFDFIALLAMVCALSLQFLPETPADRALFSEYAPGREVLKKRLYEFSRSVLVFSHSLSPSLEHVQAFVLLAIYQLVQNEGSLTGYYHSYAASIRMAQSLLMNQDASISWKLGPLEVEIRRRVWWTLFIFDRQQCLILRRPYIIHEQHCSVKQPQALDQGQFQDSREREFLILQIRWAKLIGELWDKCFTAEPPSYNNIFCLEKAIRKFELELSSSLRLPALQATPEHPCILFQSRVLTLQVYHARILLLRPFLFIKTTGTSATDRDEGLVNFQHHAKYVCLMLCKRLLAWQLLVQNQTNHSHLRWADCVARIFDSALTIAFTIISDPAHTQNRELDDWVSLAQNLLRDIGHSNAITPKALQCFDLVQKYTRTVIERDVDVSNVLAPSIALSQYLERATQTMAQPQPSLSDLFATETIRKAPWGAEKVAAYLSIFPSFELCCENFDLEPLQNFLANARDI